MSRSSWNWPSFFAGIGSAILILGAIWIATVLVGSQQLSEQASYEQCLAELGFTRESATADELDDLIAAAEACS